MSSCRATNGKVYIVHLVGASESTAFTTRDDAERMADWLKRYDDASVFLYEAAVSAAFERVKP